MSSSTLNYTLYLPDVREKGWGPKVNLNFTTIDLLLKNLNTSKSFVNHIHEIPAINGLQAALDSKANIAHNHAIPDINGLQALLDGYMTRLSRLEASVTYTPAPAGQPTTVAPPAPISPGSLSVDFTSAITSHGNAYTFTSGAVTASPANPAFVTWNWSYGDGQSRSLTLAGGTSDTATHTYASGGTYTVTLTLTSSGYSAFTVMHSVTVAVDGTITFDWNAVVPAPGGTTVTLAPTAVSTSNGQPVALYSWDFGDGAGTTNTDGSNVTHTYPAIASGLGQGGSVNYTVTLTLSGPNLVTRSVSHTATAYGPDYL